MSILIKRAKPPKNCWECLCNDLCGAIAEMGGACPFTERVIERNEFDAHSGIHHDCPLVEIPTHGRLIDADEYEKHLASIANTFARSDAQKSLMGRAIFCLENAPTVIESEEQERTIFLDESIDETAGYGEEQEN